MIGIESNKAELKNYNSSYKILAKNKIRLLQKIIGDKVIKIEHVGSTAIIGIKSKPIIDIVIGIKNFYNIDEIKNILKINDIVFSK